MSKENLSTLAASVCRRERRRLFPKRSRECAHVLMVQNQECSLRNAGMMGERWGDGENEFVVRHRSWTTLSLAMMLGRSWAAVKGRRAFLAKL